MNLSAKIPNAIRLHKSAGLAIRPVWRFVRAYFFRLGFLDGWQGCYIAWLNAFSTASKYAKLREARLKDRGRP